MDRSSSPGEAPGNAPASGGRWIAAALKSALGVALFALFLGAGFWLGPKLRGAYDTLFPQAAYTSGNYDALYRHSGKQVVMFSTSTCPYCRKARELLTQERVDFQDFVVDQSAEAEAQFDALGGGGVPQIFIGDKRIVGFRENLMRESLAALRR